MKKTILILTCLFCCFTSIKAQTCTTPFTITTNGAWKGLDSFNVSERWHKFKADSSHYVIKIYVKNFDPADFSVNLFENNCGTLTTINPAIAIYGDSVLFPNDTGGVSSGPSPYASSKDTIIIHTDTLVKGNSYLIRLTNSDGGNYAAYKISASAAAGNPNKALTGCGLSGGLNICGYTGTCGELVCNGGFECQNNSPNMNGSLSYGYANNWSGANDGSPDLFSTSAAAIYYYLSVPCNGPGQQAGHNGSNSYAGIGVYGTPAQQPYPFTEYIQTKLSAPMTANTPYMVSFYVSKADRSSLSIDNLSIFTSTSQIYQPTAVAGAASCLTITPAATISNTTILNDKANWQLVSFCYTPHQSGLQYLAIGATTNSQSATPTTTSAVTCTAVVHNMTAGWAYLYIDDVSVKAISDGINNVTQTVCAGAAMPYNAMPCTTNDTYAFSWSPGTGLSSSTSPNPVITISSSQTYTTTLSFTTTSGQSCSASSTLALIVNTTCCSTTLTPYAGTVMPVTHLIGSLFVNNDIAVPAGQTAGFNAADVKFGPGVKVTVNNGSTLYIRGSHLYGCATQMWQGIVVKDGGKVMTYPSGNLVEDAVTAIDLSSASGTYSTTALDISETVFNKNYIDIAINNFPSAQLNALVKIKSCVFTCRTLTFTSNSWPTTSMSSPGLRTAVNATTGLTPPYTLQNASATTLKNPYAGQTSSVAIWMSNAGATFNNYLSPQFFGIQIGDPGNDGNFNLFDSHCYFIFSTNSNVYSYNNVFQNTTLFTGAPIRGPRLPVLMATQGGYAILAQVIGGGPYDPDMNTVLSLNPNANTNSSLGNRFWNCHVGVKTVNTFSINSSYATFRSTQSNASSINNFFPGFTGISASTNRFNNYQLSNINFNNINNPINISVNPGSYVAYNTLLNGVYAGNIIITGNYFGASLTNTTSLGTSYLNQAVVLSSAVGNTWNSAGNNGIYIANNVINRAYNGISCSGLKTITSQIVTNTISMVDQNVNPALDQRGISLTNCTVVTVANNDLVAANTTNTRLMLVYAGYNSAPSVRCNTLSTAYQGFVFEASNQGTFWKGNKMSGLKRGLTIKSSGIIGTQGSSGSPSDNQWSGSWTGNSHTFSDNSMAQSSALYVKTGTPWAPTLNSGVGNALNFYGSSNTIYITTGTYSCTGGTGGGWPSSIPGNLTVPDIGDYSNTDQFYVNNMMLYRYLQNNDSLRDSTKTLSNFYSGLSGSSIESFVNVEQDFYDGNISSAISTNDGVSYSNVMEYGAQRFYGLYGAYVDSSFTSSDSTDLLDLASGCPGIANGVWIYQARALYNTIYGGAEMYATSDCLAGPKAAGDNSAESSSSEATITEAKTKWTVDLFPNPATNQLSLVSKNNSEVLEILITDVNGRMVLKQSVRTTAFIANLDLDLVNGMYFINIANIKHESITKKLVITK